MKTTLTIILAVIFLEGQAQSMTGRWMGQLRGEGGSVASNLLLRQSGNTLAGSVMMTQNGISESYKLSGQANGNTAAGTVMINEVAFAFELQTTGGQLVLAIGLLGQAILQGQYARSTATSPTTTPARTQLHSSGVAGQWEQMFRGRRLIYLSTANGLSRKWYYDLCNNGEYAYRNLTNYLSGEFSQSFDDSEQGTWRVVMRGNVAYLECSPQNKASYLKTIAPLTREQVSLEGQRYFLDTNQSCR